MTTRRELLVASAFGVGLAPLSISALAAEPRLRKVGLLSPVFPISDARWQAFLTGMRELGYVDGRNIALTWRGAEGKNERIPGLVADLIGAGVEIIVTHTNAAVAAARKVTTSVPIVAAAFSSPLLGGFVASLARPGGNVTGISIESYETIVKLIEFARAITPKLARAAILGEPDSPSHQGMMKDMAASLAKAGIKALPLWARTSHDVDAGFVTVAQERTEAVFVLMGAFMVNSREQIAQLALRARIPTYTHSVEFPQTGSLLGYGSYLPAHFHRAAALVDKILKGAKPGDLPVEQPTKFELVINLKTAKALGLSILNDVLFRADKVIE